MKYLFILFISISANAKSVWVKPDASSFTEDKQFCQVYAHEFYGSGGLLRRVLGQKLKFDKCMKERGWHKEQR